MLSKPLRADARRNRAKILDAAGEVFAERGPSASTEEVAARAGVAIGTVFRHFPTKQDLLGAILKGLLADLTSAADADLFAFFTRVVTAAAEKKVVVELLAREGVAVGVEGPVAALGGGVDGLLAAAKEAGTVRADVRLDEVLALLTATAQGALRGDWPAELRERVLARVFAGLVTRPRTFTMSRPAHDAPGRVAGTTEYTQYTRRPAAPPSHAVDPPIHGQRLEPGH